MITQFTPGPDAARAFRDALGCFGTGVTIITCADAKGPLGMTANSFASVSLDPPLVLWSPARSSARHDSFVVAQDFAIHILKDSQLDLATQIARDGRLLADCPDLEVINGLPMLTDCLVRLVCTHHAAHPAGDHTIVLGQVTEVTQAAGVPLMFTQGQYGRFTNGI